VIDFGKIRSGPSDVRVGSAQEMAYVLVTAEEEVNAVLFDPYALQLKVLVLVLVLWNGRDLFVNTIVKPTLGGSKVHPLVEPAGVISNPSG